MLIAVAVAAAGCGGGGAKNLPQGASVAPASAPAFMSIDTRFSSAQWKSATRLALRFPAARSLLDTLNTFKSAVGHEVDVVWLDFRDGGADNVILTKPRSKKKLKAFLHSQGDLFAQTAVGDWLAVSGDATLLDRLKRLAKGRKLDGDKDFRDAFGKLDHGAVVRAWVRGSAVQGALDRALERSGAPPNLTRDVGALQSIAGWARAEKDGVRAEAAGTVSPAPNPKTYAPSLASSLPKGALLYVSFAHLDDPTKIILRLVGRSKPNFNRQLGSVQGVLGINLRNDVYPLVRGEGALAVYPHARIPAILFVQKVRDEEKAKHVVGRIAAIAQLGAKARLGSTTIGGVEVQSIGIPNSRVTIYDAVFDGKVVVTNDKPIATRAIVGGARLSDDPLFRTARAKAHLPGKVVAFTYGDLRHGLPFVFDFAQRTGSRVPPAARANTKPLESALVYATTDANRFVLSGFATIK